MILFREAARIVSEGVALGAFPGAAIEVGRAGGPRWQHTAGRLAWDGDSDEVEPSTVYDLASLTKAIATTTLTMRAVDDGALGLDDRVDGWLPGWRGADRAQVTVRDLLAHCSGLPAYLPFFRNCTGRAEFEPEMCSTALEYEPRTQSIYSDLGFILLGFIVEDARAKDARARGTREGGRGAFDPRTTLAGQFKTLASYITPEPLCFHPPRSWRGRIAPTEHDPHRGRLLVGEVHDENAWALGGAAGHAGLFGTAGAVGAFARAVLRTLRGEPILARPETFGLFIQRTGVPGSSRALGWDTMLPTSSCGAALSPTAIGHTGFTGTSLWIDWERDFYVVLLTNRVHPTRENERIREVRPRLHEAIAASMGG
ncbi:serine hydrolase domain-containing protein [soil metagenome]